MGDVNTAPASGKSLSTRQVVIYGVPRFGNALMYLAIAVYLSKFYTDTLYLPAGFIAFTLLIGRVWDAITDPIMGHISDNIKWKMGRRRPFFLISAVPLAVAYYFLWSPPTGLSEWGLFFYLTVTYLLTYTFWTVFSIPYSSLGAEMTMDYHERTRLIGVREIFGVSGTIVATFVMAPQVATRIFGDLRVGYSTLAIWAGAVSAALILFAFFGVKEKPEFQRRETVPLRKSVRLVFKNRAFRRLLLAFVIHLIGGAFIPILVLYIQDYVIKVQIAQWIILTYLCCTMVSIPIWTRLSGRMGKKKAWSYSLVFISVVAMASMYYHEGTWLTWYLFAAMAGFGAGAAPAIAPSMMADVIDLDELESGTRREGAYFGMWAFVDKSAIGVASFIGMGTLGALGYDGHLEVQSDSVWWSLKILYSVLPAIFNGWAYFLLRGYPIDQKEHERIRSEIEAKKNAPEAEIA